MGALAPRFSLCAYVIALVLLSTTIPGYAYSSSKKLTKEEAMELWQQEKSKIDEIDHAISQISYQKLDLLASKDVNIDMTTLNKQIFTDTNNNIDILKKYGVKIINGDNIRPIQPSMGNNKLLNIDSTQLPANYTVYVYDFLYYTPEVSKNNDYIGIESTESSYVWQGHPMRLIWVNATDDIRYFQSAVNEPLDKVGETVINVAKNLVNLGFSELVSGIWKPLGTAIDLLGIDITSIIPTDKVTTSGSTGIIYYTGTTL